MSVPSQRRAFTLVELLVVIAIIGILVALLLPAVQAAREAARRTQCSNNLKQLALAAHNYHDVHNRLPPGHLRGTGGNTGASSNREAWGWHVFIMPFIEQGSLYDQLEPGIYTLREVCAGANPAVPDPVSTLQTKIDTFICPSDTNDGIAHQNRHFGGGVGTNAGGLGNWRPGLTNYVGNRGLRDQVQATADPWGIFFYDSGIRVRDIIDGTSNTIMIGERDTRRCRSGAWPGVRNPDGSGGRGIWTVKAHGRAAINSPLAVFNWDHSKGCGEGFSSMHAGGAQFALCDASVRFISETISSIRDANPAGGPQRAWDEFPPGHPNYAWFTVWQRLIRRDDGFEIGSY